jgi:hypothetical protein
MEPIVAGAGRKVSPDIAVATDGRSGHVLTAHMDEELKRLCDPVGWCRLSREAFCADFAEAE